MIFDRIELKDNDYSAVKKSSKVRKIKFKSASFKNIFNTWNNFRLKFYNGRLEKAKESVADMEFGAGSFDRKTGQEHSKAEAKILRKAAAVARLEAKIRFLQHGTEVTDDFVSSRAIKIKDNMMKNMRFNSNNAYSVAEDKKASIFEEATEPKTEASVVDAARKGVRGALDRIMKEKPVTPEPSTSNEETTTPIIKAPTKAEIRETVDAMFAEEQARREREAATEVTTEAVTEPVVTKTEVRETVEEKLKGIDVVPTVGRDDVAAAIRTQLDQIDVTPTIKKDDVADTIREELGKINVTKNQSNKVNPYINEDGTYRMRREDIDEDFRVTRVAVSDREKRIEDMRNQHLTVQAAFVRSMQIIKDNLDKQAAKEKSEVKPAEPAKREMPVVTPTRTPAQEVKALNKAVDNATTVVDLTAIMAAVTELQRRQETAKSREAELDANEEALKADKAKAVEELLAYQASLEADVTSRTRGLDEREANNRAMEQEISSIRQVMGRR